jgi:hypothetical protein
MGLYVDHAIEKNHRSQQLLGITITQDLQALLLKHRAFIV